MRSDGIIAVVREDAETEPERALGNQCAGDIALCASRRGIRDVEAREALHVGFVDGAPQLLTFLLRYPNICHQWSKVFSITSRDTDETTSGFRQEL